jgi:phosphomannomutase
MNVAQIRRVTLALAQYVMATHAEVGAPRMVVGYDARLDSQRFAREVVGVLSSVGIDVVYFDEPVPTPQVVFAGTKLHADATIVVTASHNPAVYSGYKVYGRNAVQIVPPMDQQVMRLLAHVGPASAIAVDHGRAERLGEKWYMDYANAVCAGRVDTSQVPSDQVLSSSLSANQGASLHIAYSPLHGVGGKMACRVLREAGYTEVVVEPSQFAPDGHFPTTAFPNPEEPLAMARGLALAEQNRADLLLVNDPDADRLAVALPDEAGKFHSLTGNQIGVILTSYILSSWVDRSLLPVVVSTLVSTPMTGLIAKAHGAYFETTLTGFKWLWTAALALLEEPNRRFAIAFEEALGYSTHVAVRDKDGIAAGLLFADWVSLSVQQGVLPWHALGALYAQHGAWASVPYNVVRTGPGGLEEIAAAVGRIAVAPPTALGGRRVTQVVDYRIADPKRPKWRAVADMVELRMDDDARIVMRPSGTEPKLKFYADVQERVGEGEEPFVAYGRAETQAKNIVAELLTACGLSSA